MGINLLERDTASSIYIKIKNNIKNLHFLQ
jgi:hypothetical protein